MTNIHSQSYIILLWEYNLYCENANLPTALHDTWSDRSWKPGSQEHEKLPYVLLHTWAQASLFSHSSISAHLAPSLPKIKPSGQSHFGPRGVGWQIPLQSDSGPHEVSKIEQRKAILNENYHMQKYLHMTVLLCFNSMWRITSYTAITEKYLHKT